MASDSVKLGRPSGTQVMQIKACAHPPVTAISSTERMSLLLFLVAGIILPSTS